MCVGEKVNGVDLGKGVQTAMFDCSSDWDREIKRTGASEWRVCAINEEYLVSPRCVFLRVCARVRVRTSMYLSVSLCVCLCVCVFVCVCVHTGCTEYYFPNSCVDY